MSYFGTDDEIGNQKRRLDLNRNRTWKYKASF